MLAPEKIPSKWKLVKQDNLLWTNTHKVICSGLSTHLSLDPVLDDINVHTTTKAVVD